MTNAAVQSNYRATFGEEFTVPMEACYIGPDAAKNLAAFAKDRCGKRVVVISDANTRAAAGEDLYDALGAVGKAIVEKNYPAQPLDATDTEGDRVAALDSETDAFVAIGSGTLCDLAKHAGTKLGKPVLLYPTAASMNGYTSGIVALKVNGLKRTIPCDVATGVFADPRIVATAPKRMTAAGVADFLSKASASSDWQAASYLRGEWYSDQARVFVGEVQGRLLDCVDDVGSGDDEAIGLTLEALILSGFSMVVAGSSSPASGGEHLISHYIDMKSSLYGSEHDLHGTQVGVATVYCLELWERVLGIDPSTFDINAAIDGLPSPAEIDQHIESDWGPIADEVREQWKQKARDTATLKKDLTKFRDGIDELRENIAADRLPSKTVRDAILRSGGLVTAEELHAPTDVYHDGQKRARYIRSRYTILDLAAETGIAPC